MYSSKLPLIETEKAIKLIKDNFQLFLAEELNLTRISAPLFVEGKTGFNDDLNSVEKPISFSTKLNQSCQIVQSLAKLKRFALYKYDFKVGEGLYTDMNAIRLDEDLSELHSYYVDQWDWEVVINKVDRTIDTLKNTVKKIYSAFKRLENLVNKNYPVMEEKLPKEIFFLTSQELEDMYPEKSPKERETEITRKYGAVFVIGVGAKLKSGEPHDLRAPDYDDWQLNGDILLHNRTLDKAIELSSMGIRVTEETLMKQLKICDKMERLELDFHKMLMDKKLPYTIGGGIGASRLCLYFLEKYHVGEVQVSVWPQQYVEEFKKKNVYFL